MNNYIQTPRQRFLEDPIRKAHENPLTIFETGIPMRDGIELAADVYLPTQASRPAPAIVQSTPYDKSQSIFFKTEAEFFQKQGYIVVVHDVRGRGKSEGCWRAFVNDGPDTHDVIEWVACQDWCTGKVGTTGLSYAGWTQWAAAAEMPPHLSCMISTSAAGRWQQEIPYSYGVFQLYFGWWVYLVRRRITEMHGLEEHDWEAILQRLPLSSIGDFMNPAGETWQDMLNHDTLDDHWKSLRFDERYADIDVPCLHVTGWYDMEDLMGAFHHYEHMMEASPARDNQRLIVGPWSHINCRWPHSSYGGLDFGPEAALDMDSVHLRWFDYWLKGKQNGVPDDPAVKIFEPGKNAWLHTDRWPLADTETLLFLRFVGETGVLSAASPTTDEPERSYQYNPVDPAPTRMDIKQYPLEDIPLDQTPVESRPDVLSYSSEVLSKELVVSGWSYLKIYAASNCEDTEWHVKITDVHPDGRSMKVTQGCLRASYRDSLEKPSPLVPNVIYTFDIELWPTHHVFLPDHCIRVTITSSDFPWFARSMNCFGKIADLATPVIATNSVFHTHIYPSCLKLPVQQT
jgi:putative CocE/NonD family hydrolase